MSFLSCIAFRAADDKLPSDVSRNWDRIENVIPRALTHGVTVDPKDAAVYIIGLKDTLDDGAANALAAQLDSLRDARDNRPLIGETSCRTMHEELFGARKNTGRARLDFGALNL